jgi:hypothetical protein
MADRWIQKATAKMKRKGTVGKFGNATEKKIAAGKKAGGVKKKEAVFAQNMKGIAKHKGHDAIGDHPGYSMKTKKR